MGRKCLRAGIEAVKPGAMLVEVGEAIQQCADENNVWVVQGFCGHGIGQVMHQQPQVLHFPCRSTKEMLIGISSISRKLLAKDMFTLHSVLKGKDRPGSSHDYAVW